MILCIIPLYVVAINVSKDNELNIVSSQFATAFTNLDELLEELISKNENITQKSDLILLATKTGDFSPSDYMIMKNLCNSYNEVLRGKNNIDYLFVVNRTNPLLISNNMVSDDYEDLYGIFYSIRGYDLEAWKSAIFDDSAGFYFIPSTACQPFVTEKQARYQDYIHFIVRPTQSSYRPSNLHAVYMLNSENVLKDFIQDYFSDYAFLQLEDVDGNVFLTYGDSPAPNGSKHTTFTYESSFYKATLGIEEAFFHHRVEGMRNFLWFYICVTIVVAIVASIVLTIRQQRPLGTLVRSLANYNPTDPDAYSGKDYDYISDTLSLLDSERKQYEKEAETLKASISNTLIHSMLRGELYSPSEQAMCLEILALQGDDFLIAVLQPQENLSILEISKINARVDGLLSADAALEYRLLNLDTHLTYILFALPESAPWDLQTFDHALREVHRILHQEYGETVYAGIGSPEVGVHNISDSATNAKNVLRLCDAAHPVRIYQENPSARDELFNLSVATLNKLKNLISTGDENPIVDFYDKLYLDLKSYPHITEENMNNIFFCIKNTITEVCNQYLPAFLKSFPLEQKAQTQSAKAAIRELQEYTLLLAKDIKALHQQESHCLAHQILVYIEENFADSSLCAGSIADQFVISEKYVFSLVKTQTGKSLGEYIESIRFAKAEQMLRDDVSISEIPERIGINSINTFYKAFKRIYGISPAKWREMQE